MADHDAPPTLHLYVLLDRSGSMESMRNDVVEGLNTLLYEQKTAGGASARFTFVQFDTADPQQVLVDAIPMSEATPFTHEHFQPRGGTPLLDATGRLIGRATNRMSTGVNESVVIATITDGLENTSGEFKRSQIVELIKAKTAEGWTFVFLGADPASYDEANRMGHDVRSTQHFAPDGAGARTAFAELSRATSGRRAKLAAKESFDAGDYFEGDKRADDDRKRRRDR
jgi:Mg-chelatase subunit ChlD